MTQDSDKNGKGWIQGFMAGIPGRKMTGAQAFNLASEALFVVAFMALLTRVSELVAAGSFLVLFFWVFICHFSTKRR